MTRRTRPSSASVLSAVTALVCGVLAAVVLMASPAQAASFSNAAPITIADAPCGGAVGQGSPYPSNIVVSGLTGTVSDVNVTLNGVTHPFQGDLEILLVSPLGGSSNLELLSDAGTGALSNATVTFDDAGAGQAPQNTPWPPGTYKPSNYTELTGADPFPPPAPTPSANTALASFNGIAPNGTWSLYVLDDGCGDAGSITGGWSIDITTAALPSTTTVVTSSLNPSRTGQSVTFTATVTSSGNPVTTGTVTFTQGATVLASNVAVNASGQATFTTSGLTQGNHLVTATYNPNASFNTSSGSVNQRVDNNTVVTGNVYCNTGPITINDNGPAFPYPSNIFVTGAPTTLGTVTVTLKNVTHSFAGDVEAMLVGPTGQNLVVLSDAGTAGVSNVTVTFDDAAAGPLPQNGAWAAPNATVTADPTNYTELQADTFPAPAPAPSAATTLAAFTGTNPNGTWSLYVKDDGAPDIGSIAGGWCITLTTSDTTPPSVTITQAGGQTDPTSTSPVNFTATFDEPVSGFTGADVSFAGSTAPGTLVATVTGGPSLYNIAVSGMTGSGLVVVGIPAGAVVDGASNPNTASVNTDSSVLFRSRQSLPAVVTGSVNWKLRDVLSGSGPPTVTFTYGTTPLVPIMGDWDGNGTKTAGTFERGVFKLNNANDSSAADITFTFGNPRGFPVVGDWNGDGIDDVAVFAAGTWETRLTGAGTLGSFSFGPALNWPTVVPVAGDWDGDGVDGIGVYNLSGGGPLGQWNLRETASAGAPQRTFTFGGSGQYPVTGDWDADGTDGIGTKTMSGSLWTLRDTASGAGDTETINFGAANDFPLVWRN